MKVFTPEKLSELQGNSSNVRNVCILAHVDHGKTTLADSLVASNGIISNKLVGKLRYLDSRPDEQLRGITMKSSSIALYHQFQSQDYLINLIDSPGHVDFASEVSTAVRLCDGVLIIVDVVEGVCPQTRSALAISYIEGLKPILVLNKIDRLITEIKLSPLDAYVHLSQVLEQVNAVMGELFTSDVMEREEKEETTTTTTTCAEARANGNPEQDSKVERERAFEDWQSALEDIDDSHLYFSPDQGNVLFASAVDGWGFGIKEFAKLFAEKLGFSERVLCKTLWGDFYYNGKSKRILKGAQEKAKKNLFVQLILENLWSIYETVVVRKDKDKVGSIADKLQIKLTTRDLRHTDPKAQLQAICSQWMPLARACLHTVCEKVPSANSLDPAKVERLMVGNGEFAVLPHETQELKNAFLACDPSETSPVIVFISKMFPVDRTSLPENKPKPLTQQELSERREIARQRHAEKLEREKSEGKVLDDGVMPLIERPTPDVAEEKQEEEEQAENALVAFARIYAGTLKIGDEVYVLGPKHQPAVALARQREGEVIDPKLLLKDLKDGRHVTRVTIDKLYLLMGRELEPISQVPAGNVFGIGNLEEHVLKTATLSTTIACPSFSELTSLAIPILRVALEPKHPNDLHKLMNGLKLLNQADACAVVHIQESGEIVLSTAGEIHLERCLEDLKLRYAKVSDINVSEPIVSFRETIVPPPKVDMVNEAIEKKTGEESACEIWTSNRQCCVHVDAKPLPDSVTRILERNGDLIKLLHQRYEGMTSEEGKLEQDNHFGLSERKQKAVETFKSELRGALEEAEWPEDCMEKIWSFGPRKCGPNVLLNETDYKRNPFWERLTNSTDARAT